MGFAGTGPGTGFPQTVQNWAPSGNGLPHFGQNWAAIPQGPDTVGNGVVDPKGERVVTQRSTPSTQPHFFRTPPQMLIY